MRWSALVLPVLLAGCIGPEGGWPDQGVAPAEPVIEIATGGSFNGWMRTEVYDNELVIHESAGPFGEDPVRVVVLASPGTFARVAATLTAAAPAALAAVNPEALACTDYGYDMVRADPPIAGFSELGSGCPDPAMTTFIGAVLSAIPTPS